MASTSKHYATSLINMPHSRKVVRVVRTKPPAEESPAVETAR